MRDTNAMLCPLLGLSTIQVAAMSKPDVIPVPTNLPGQTHTTALMPADTLLCWCILLLPSCCSVMSWLCCHLDCCKFHIGLVNDVSIGNRRGLL